MTRDDRGKTAERGYGGRWQRERLAFLGQNPLCRMCQDIDRRVTAATVVDHIKAHKGDPILMWDQNNWQPLCAAHHNSDKQRIDNGGKPIVRIGEDGWPVE